MTNTLTRRQKEILDFVQGYSEKNGYAPSLEETRKKFRLAAISTVHQHLKTLERKGFLKREKGQPRGMGVVERETMMKIPLLGTIAAGQPLTLFDTQKESIAVPKNKIPSSAPLTATHQI